MKRAVLGLLFVLGALGASWWLARPASPPRVDRGASQAMPAPVPRIEAPEKPAATERTPLAVDVVAPELRPAPRSGGFDVLVVDGSSAEPVAGAEVHWSNSNQGALIYDRAHPLNATDLERILDREPSVTTDATGMARIDTISNPGQICARKGELFGSLVVDDRKQSPIRIKLSRDVNFDVQVVDADGKPVAGVPVGIRNPSARHADPDLHTTSTEGEQGIARVSHLQSRMYGNNPPSTVLVHLAMIGFDKIGETVDLANLPTEPVKLELPACGSILVTMHDSLGQKISTEFLNLAAGSELDERGLLSFGARSFEPSLIETGRVVYPFVPVGLEVYVDAFSHGMMAQAQGPGPSVAGEQVSFDLDLGTPRPVVSGRLIDESGSAIGSCEVQLQFEGSGANGATMGETCPGRTEDDGTFRATMSLGPSPDLVGSLVIRPLCAGYGNGEAVRITLDANIHDGENDFGDLIVHAPQVLVRGRVVDDLGAPVALALVGGEVLETNAAGTPQWRGSSALGANSLSDGAFTVKGIAPNGRLRLQAVSSGYVEGEKVEAAVGASDVTIVLTRASKIAGRLLLDDAAASGRIQIHTKRASDTQYQIMISRMREHAQIKPDGTFELVDVRPGLSDLTFILAGQNKPILVIDALTLRPGEPSTDPRLASIDLRGKIP